MRDLARDSRRFCRRAHRRRRHGATPGAHPGRFYLLAATTIVAARERVARADGSVTLAVEPRRPFSALRAGIALREVSARRGLCAPPRSAAGLGDAQSIRGPVPELRLARHGRGGIADSPR